MKSIKRVFYIATLFAASAISSSGIASGQPTSENQADWSYVIAYGGSSPWLTKSGWARASVRPGIFAIDILDPDGRTVERISGTIVGSRVKAKRQIFFTDLAVEGLEGSYTRLVDGRTTYEVFSLRNAYSVIGVNRIAREK